MVSMKDITGPADVLHNRYISKSRRNNDSICNRSTNRRRLHRPKSAHHYKHGHPRFPYTKRNTTLTPSTSKALPSSKTLVAQLGVSGTNDIPPNSKKKRATNK